MNLDSLREAWLALEAVLNSDSDADNIIARCKARARQFRIGLLVSDILEIGVGLAMVWVWVSPFNQLFAAHRMLMYLGATSILTICAFLAGARILRYVNGKRALASVSGQLRRQLYAVNQRIWLLRNLVWWYLTPCAIAIFTVLIAVGVESRKSQTVLAASGAQSQDNMLLHEGIYVTFCALFFAGVYWLNQRAVHKYLMPLKEDLEKTISDIEGSVTE